MATGDVLNILIIAIISFLSSYSSKQTALNVFDNPNIYIYIYSNGYTYWHTTIPKTNQICSTFFFQRVSDMLYMNVIYRKQYRHLTLSKILESARFQEGSQKRRFYVFNSHPPRRLLTVKNMKKQHQQCFVGS